MAVVRPMKRVGSDLRAMTSAEVTQIIDECIRLYGTAPGISLTVTSDAVSDPLIEQKLGTLRDRRLPAGPVSTSSTPPAPAGAHPSHLDVNYDNTLQRYEWGVINSNSFPHKNRSNSSYQNYSHPLHYRDVNSSIQAMSWLDMYDTFINPALTRLASGTTTPADNAGTYFVSTATSETDATLVSSTPIAKDTISDYAAFATGNLPEVEDQPDPTNETNFYLHIVDAPAEGPVPLPVTMFGSNNDFKTLDKPKFRDMLLDIMQYWAWDPANATSTAIRYQYGDAAYLSGQGMNQRGSGITDKYVSSVTERTGQNAPNPNATAYYSQKVPYAGPGYPTVQHTNYLGIGLF